MRSFFFRQIQRIQQAGAEVHICLADGKKNSMHLKAAVFDENILWRGSANWSVNANERFLEDVLIFRCPNLARHYLRQFQTSKYPMQKIQIRLTVKITAAMVLLNLSYPCCAREINDGPERARNDHNNVYAESNCPECEIEINGVCIPSKNGVRCSQGFCCEGECLPFEKFCQPPEKTNTGKPPVSVIDTEKGHTRKEKYLIKAQYYIPFNPWTKQGDYWQQVDITFDVQITFDLIKKRENTPPEKYKGNHETACNQRAFQQVSEESSAQLFDARLNPNIDFPFKRIAISFVLSEIIKLFIESNIITSTVIDEKAICCAYYRYQLWAEKGNYFSDVVNCRAEFSNLNIKPDKYFGKKKNKHPAQHWSK